MLNLFVALLLALVSIMAPVAGGAASLTRDYLLRFANEVQDLSGDVVKHIRTMEDGSSSMAAVNIIVRRAGAAYATTAGLAYMMSGIYDEGYQGISAVAYHNMLDTHGVSIKYDVTYDDLIISIYAMPDELEFALKTVGSVLSKPKFDSETFEKVRGAMIASLEYQASNNTAVVTQYAVRGKIFPSHAYGAKLDGSIESLRGLALGDLDKYSKRSIASSNMAVAAAGKVESKSLVKILDSVFSALPNKPAGGVVSVADVAPVFSSDEVKLRANSGKSVIGFAQGAVGLHDKDYAAYSVLTSLLGRSDLESILMRRARDLGLSYRIGMAPVMDDHSSFTYGFAIVEKHKERKIIDLIGDVLRHVEVQAAKNEQVEAAKAYELGKMALALVSCADKANFLAYLLRHNLSASDILIRYDALTEVSTADVVRVAKQVIDFRKMSIVIVG